MNDPEALRSVEVLFESERVPSTPSEIDEFVTRISDLPYIPRVSFLPRLIQTQKGKIEQLFTLTTALLHYNSSSDETTALPDVVDQEYVELFHVDEKKYSSRFDVLQIALFALPSFNARGIDEILKFVKNCNASGMRKLSLSTIVKSPVSDETIMDICNGTTLSFQKSLIFYLCKNERRGILDMLYAKFESSHPDLAYSFLHACTKATVERVVVNLLPKELPKTEDDWSKFIESGTESYSRARAGSILSEEVWRRMIRHEDTLYRLYENMLRQTHQRYPLRWAVIHLFWTRVFEKVRVSKATLRKVYELIEQYPPLKLVNQLSADEKRLVLQCAKNKAPIPTSSLAFSSSVRMEPIVASLDTEKLSLVFQDLTTKNEPFFYRPGWGPLIEAVVGELQQRLRGGRKKDRRVMKNNRSGKSSSMDIVPKRALFTSCVERMLNIAASPVLLAKFYSGNDVRFVMNESSEDAEILSLISVIPHAKRAAQSQQATKVYKWCHELVTSALVGREIGMVACVLSGLNSLLESLVSKFKTDPSVAPSIGNLASLCANLTSMTRIDSETTASVLSFCQKALCATDLAKPSSIQEGTPEVLKKTLSSLLGQKNELSSKPVVVKWCKKVLSMYVDVVRARYEYSIKPRRMKDFLGSSDERLVALILTPLQTLQKMCNLDKELALHLLNLSLQLLDHVSKKFVECSEVSSSLFVSRTLQSSDESKFEMDENDIIPKFFSRKTVEKLQKGMIEFVCSIFDQVAPGLSVVDIGIAKATNLSHKVVSFSPVVFMNLDELHQFQVSLSTVLSRFLFCEDSPLEAALHNYTLQHFMDGASLSLLCVFIKYRDVVPVDRLVGAAVEDLFEKVLCHPGYAERLFGRRAATLFFQVGKNVLPRRYQYFADDIGDSVNKAGKASVDWFDRATSRAYARHYKESWAQVDLMKLCSVLNPLCVKVYREQCVTAVFEGRSEAVRNYIDIALKSKSGPHVLDAFRMFANAIKNEQAAHRIELLDWFSEYWSKILELFVLKECEYGVSGELFEIEFTVLKPRKANRDKSLTEELAEDWLKMIRGLCAAVNMDRRSTETVMERLKNQASQAQSYAFIAIDGVETISQTRRIWYRTACSAQKFIDSKTTDDDIVLYIPSWCESPKVEYPEQIEDLLRLKQELKVELPDATKYLRVLCKSTSPRRDQTDISTATILPQQLIELVQDGYRNVLGMEKPFRIAKGEILERDCVILRRIRGLISTLKNQWFLIPDVAQSIGSVAASCLSDSVPDHHIKLAADLYLSLCRDYYFMPCVWNLGEALFSSLPKFNEADSESAKISRGVARAYYESTMSKFATPEMDIIGKYIEENKMNTENRVIEDAVFILLEACQNVRRTKAKDKLAAVKGRCEVAVKSIEMCLSAIHLPYVRDVIGVFRQDLSSLYFNPNVKDYEGFRGVFSHDIEKENRTKEQFKEEEVLLELERTVGYRLNRLDKLYPLRTPHNVLLFASRQYYRDGQNPGLEYTTRASSVRSFLSTPAVSSEQIVGLLRELFDKAEDELNSEENEVNVETQLFISTFIGNIFSNTSTTSDPKLPLALLLSPAILSKSYVFNFNVIGIVGDLLPDFMIVETLRLALDDERRKVLRLSAHKSILKLLCTSKSPAALDLLMSEWNRRDDLDMNVILVILQFVVDECLTVASGALVDFGFAILASLVSSVVADSSIDEKEKRLCVFLFKFWDGEDSSVGQSMLQGYSRCGSLSKIDAELVRSLFYRAEFGRLHSELVEQYMEKVMFPLIEKKDYSDETIVFMRIALILLCEIFHENLSIQQLEEFWKCQMSSVESISTVRGLTEEMNTISKLEEMYEVECIVIKAVSRCFSWKAWKVKSPSSLTSVMKECFDVVLSGSILDVPRRYLYSLSLFEIESTFAVEIGSCRDNALPVFLQNVAKPLGEKINLFNFVARSMFSRHPSNLFISWIEGVKIPAADSRNEDMQGGGMFDDDDDDDGY